MCNIEKHALPEFIVTLVTNFGGVLFTVLSLACLSTHTEMEKSLRTIFLSFSVANLMGTAMLSYDTIAYICYHEAEKKSIVMTISVILSLSHLMILLLSEYIALASRKRMAKDFLGLIVISWIISITIGMVNVVSRREVRVAFSITFLLIVLILVGSYVSIFNEHLKKNKSKKVYQSTFLQRNSDITRNMKKFWMLKLNAIIIFSYAGCSIPWLINEMRDEFSTDTENSVIYSASLIIYSLNFYFPSAICMYLKLIKWMTTKGKIRQRIISSYRYRDVY